MCNKDGYELGACVVCLSSLMSRNLDKPELTESKSVSIIAFSVHIRFLKINHAIQLQLTIGGKSRGHMTASFTLRVLATATTGFAALAGDSTKAQLQSSGRGRGRASVRVLDHAAMMTAGKTK